MGGEGSSLLETDICDVQDSKIVEELKQFIEQDEAALIDHVGEDFV